MLCVLLFMCCVVMQESCKGDGQVDGHIFVTYLYIFDLFYSYFDLFV